MEKREIKKSKNWKAFFLIGLALIFSAEFSGCATLDSFSCPYVIDNPRVEIGENGNVHQFAGAYFSVYNDSDKYIKEYTVSFLLYDDEGNNPFIGSNCVIGKMAVEENPYETREAVISLDSYLSVVPDEPYKIDFMYLREIKYSDGTTWSDPFGMYAVKEVYE